MTTKTKLLAHQTKLVAELDALTKSIEAMPDEDSVITEFIPNQKDRYYYLHNWLDIESTNFDSLYPGDHARVNRNNAYPTKEQAQLAADVLKPIYKMLQFAILNDGLVTEGLAYLPYFNNYGNPSYINNMENWIGQFGMTEELAIKYTELMEQANV